jgi:membrane-bound lytic murein transglycosylase D
MRNLWTTPTLLLFLLVAFRPALLGANENTPTPTSTYFAEKDVTLRLSTISTIIKGEYDEEVMGYLRGYLLNSTDTKKLLGTTELFFPVIEHYLKLNKLPDELKYIPIIESRLRPYAASPAGAAGLWQFMSTTAKYRGLEVNSKIDERKDPRKSTSAAVKYFAYLYKRFGSWDLVMAAYNCGEGRLNKAIITAGSKDFEKVRKYLPKETQRYIPRFLAAQYICTYYMEHQLYPKYPSADLRNTKTIRVFDAYDMKKVSTVTGVSLYTLRKLNPAYKNNYLPASKQGNFIVLPQRGYQAFLETYPDEEGLSTLAHAGQNSFSMATWTVQSGGTLEKLAKLCGCSKAGIMKWNNLKTEELYYQQELVIYYPAPTVNSANRA